MARRKRRHGRSHGKLHGLGELGFGTKVGIGLGLAAAVGGALWWFFGRKPAGAAQYTGANALPTYAGWSSPQPILAAGGSAAPGTAAARIDARGY